MLICLARGYLVKVWYLLESQSLSRSPFVFADFTICTKIGVNSPWRTFQWSHACDKSIKSLDNAGPLNAFPFWQHYATSRTICSSPQIWVQKCLTSGKKQIQATSLLNDTHVWWAGICTQNLRHLLSWHSLRGDYTSISVDLCKRSLTVHLLRSFAHLEGEEPFSKSGGSHLYSAFVACVDFEIVPEWGILDSFLSEVTNL